MTTRQKTRQLSPPPPTASGQQPCQYCSVTAKANKEDPIGTAATAKLWLLIEVPQPWAKNPWDQSACGGQSAELLALFDAVEQQPQLWQDLSILAIAPDKTLSTVGKRHVFFYRQPQGATAAYTQHHYHIPTEQLCDLVRSLIYPSQDQTSQDQHDNSASSFTQYQQPATRALFVCTHTRYDLACGRFGTPLYRILRQKYASLERLSVWQTTHFGGHNFAPTLIDFPTGQFWGHLEADNPELLDTLIYRQGDVTKLERFYRGCSRFSKWGQIAERSLWMQQGWDWLAVPQSVRIIRQDPGVFWQRLLRWILPWVPTIRARILLKKLTAKLTWAEVEIQWDAQDEKAAEKSAGCYLVRVEKSHTVLTQLKSGTEAALVPMSQYQVRELSKSTG